MDGDKVKKTARTLGSGRFFNAGQLAAQERRNIKLVIAEITYAHGWAGIHAGLHHGLAGHRINAALGCQ